MVLKIVWTPQADRGLDKVIEYLEEEWTVMEILNLELNLQELLNRISKYRKSIQKQKSIKMFTKDW